MTKNIEPMSHADALQKAISIIKNKEIYSQSEAIQHERAASAFRSEETAFRISRNILEDLLNEVERTSQP